MSGYDSDQNSDHDTDENDGWGPSLYNDNQGIKMTIVFTPLHQPLEARKKRRANAKPTVITKIDHFHEALPLRNFLAKAIGTNLKHEDLFEHSWLFQGQELEDGDSFSLSYTIPHRVTDQVEIDNDKDYTQMVDEATNKAPCEVKLFIVENQTGNMGDEPEEEAEHEEAATSCKKQKFNMMEIKIRRHRDSEEPVGNRKSKHTRNSDRQHSVASISWN